LSLNTALLGEARDTTVVPPFVFALELRASPLLVQPIQHRVGPSLQNIKSNQINEVINQSINEIINQSINQYTTQAK
jgi:hypothetical protein